MTTITPDRFNALKRYVGVRLQQGVPIVDADWNELEDARRFELRAFLKWYIGNGVPHGNDGFRVQGTGQPNTFMVRRGATGTADGLAGVGRCLVDGLDVMIEQDLDFASQDLLRGQPNAANLASDRGTVVIEPLTTPTANGPVTVYLDVWERLVEPSEDQAHMINVGLGLGESCARNKREWVVRVRPGTAVPAAGDADFEAGHLYYAIARIARRTNDDNVNAADVTDFRERDLFMLPATLSQDVLGVPASDYRRGFGRPAIPLREAVNALLVGDLPGTPELLVPAGLGDESAMGGLILDDGGRLGIVYPGLGTPSGGAIFASTIDPSNVGAGFSAPPTQIAPTGPLTGFPSVFRLPNNGDFVYTYVAFGTNAIEARFRRSPQFSGLSTATDQVIAPLPATAQVSFGVQATVRGRVITFVFWQRTGPGGPGALFGIGRTHYRRYDHTAPAANAWLDQTAAVQLGQVDEAPLFLRAAADAVGDVWVAARTGTQIRLSRISPGTSTTPANIAMRAAIDAWPAGGPGVMTNETWPFVLPVPGGDVWVFWSVSNARVYYTRFTAGAWEARSELPGSQVGDAQPIAIAEPDGTILLFLARPQAQTGAPKLVCVTRRDPVSGAWTPPRRIGLGATDDDNHMCALRNPDGSFWLAWTRDVASTPSVRHGVVVRRLRVRV